MVIRTIGIKNNAAKRGQRVKLATLQDSNDTHFWNAQWNLLMNTPEL